MIKKIDKKNFLFFAVLTLLFLDLHFKNLFCDEVDSLFESCEEVEPPTAPLPGDDCIDAASILCLIAPPNNCGVGPEPFINVPLLLQENLYKRTTGPVTIRSLLDQPSLIPYVYGTSCWQFTGHAFYNYTPMVYMTQCSPFIKEYIDLTNENIINELSNNDFITADVPGILGLFHNIKLQQHRAGIMFGFAKEHNRFMFNFRTPLYYLLEHFFLNEEEQKAAEKAFEKDPTEVTEVNACTSFGPKEDTDKFVFNHLVSDKLGLGDTRLSLMYDILNRENNKFYIGLQTTIPTTKTFKKGLLGGSFSNCGGNPPFNIKRYFNLYLCAQGAEQKMLANQLINNEITDFLVGALDRLSTILINAPLGNGHHWGVGPQIDWIYKFDNFLSMHTYAAIEFFKKNNEIRYFLIKKDPAEFDRDWRDDAKAEENLTFLNQQMINTLYPIPSCAQIKPGRIYKFNHEFMYDSLNWHVSAGFDYWQEEKESMKIKKCIKDAVYFDKAQRWKAYQGKLFGSVGYYGQNFCDTFNWNALLTLEGTIFHKGIGQNYTLGLRFGLDY